jgi:tetratricopeptide (TPR) repeat protein
VGLRTGNITLFSLNAILIATFMAMPSLAQTAFVLGGGFAKDCYIAVKSGSPPRAARAVCNRALDDEALSIKDSAATRVNRGIISLRERDGDAAMTDFNAALARNPSLSAGFLNRSGAHLLQGRWLEAKIDADTAIAIGLNEDAWAGYFNKGIALEQMGQINDAYAAFQQSARLAPDRDDVRIELARFRVETSGETSAIR